MASASTNATDGVALPTVAAAHWLIRLPLAATYLYHGGQKLMNLSGGAEAMGFSLPVWTLIALCEAFGGLAILAGGVMPGRIGDLLTRAGGAAIALIMLGALYLVHIPGPWTGMEFQLLLLGSGLFFALRGNRA